MLFSSAIFIFLFFPLFLLCYFCSPRSWGNPILLLFSLLFYSWGEGWIIAVMLTSVFADFSAGLLIDSGKRKLGLGLSIVTNLGLLAYFKYAQFAFENLKSLASLLGVSAESALQLPAIALPLGISFYTFQTLSYSIDVYRGKSKANRNLLEFATYVTMFPQLVAGPIVRYLDVQGQLSQRERSLERFSSGLERFIIGLSKKMLIANTLAIPADAIFSIPAAELQASTAWLGVTLYAFQIYFDFSAYSDMAIGIARMIGIDIPENFNYPYISRSIREFWRRWHISLSNWFRDYLYIPLGGNRGSEIRTYFNLFIVFLVTGIWHGASWNFVLWGLFHGAFLIGERAGLEKLLNKLPRPISIAYTLLIVLFAWVLFRAESLSYCFEYWQSMLGLNSGSFPVIVFLNSEVILTIILATILSFPIFPFIQKIISKNKNSENLNHLIQAIYSLFIIGLLLISISYISSDSYNPFIYFRF